MKSSQSGLVDALFEVGRQRQQLLSNLRRALEEKNLGSVLLYAEQLVGLDVKALDREKSH